MSVCYFLFAPPLFVSCYFSLSNTGFFFVFLFCFRQIENAYVVSGYNCTDGCGISNSYVDDGWCDCTDCGDETYWTCDSCSSAGCANCTSGDANLCDGSGDDSGSYFYCSNGCQISSSYYNDSYCDCPSCEDEPLWTCSTCGGCPNSTNCGDYVSCSSSTTSSPDTTSMSYPTTTSSSFGTTADVYTCYSGCTIPSSYYDDGWCDCDQCEDEVYWTCDSCSSDGCANCTSGDANSCDGSGDDSGSYFYCYTGCAISASYYNDSYCDCPSCEDEPYWSCSSCGGCPNATDCGDFVECDGGSTTGGYTTTRWTTGGYTTSGGGGSVTVAPGDGCNYGLFFLFPLLDGECGSTTFPTDYFGSLMSECSNDGKSATLYYFSDNDCDDVINQTQLEAFSCGNSQSECSGVTYTSTVYGTDDCTGDSLYGATVPLAQVDDVCLDLGGAYANLDVSEAGIRYTVYLDSSCSGSDYGTFSLNATCDAFGLNSTEIAFEGFDASPTTTSSLGFTTTNDDNDSGGSSDSDSPATRGLFDARILIAGLVVAFVSALWTN